MSKQAIIFDFFDVIHRDPFNHWLRQNGLERVGEMEKAAQLFDIGKIDLEEHHRRVSEATGRSVAGLRASFDDISWIDEDMIGFIKRLKKTYKTGLLSNSATEYIGKILDRHSLESLFDVLVVSAEVRLIKPDPRIFEYAMDKLGVTAEESVFIDDNPKNVDAAARLGITGIVYDGDINKLKKALKSAGVDIGTD